jgi:hypothetical protein
MTCVVDGVDVEDIAFSLNAFALLAVWASGDSEAGGTNFQSGVEDCDV